MSAPAGNARWRPGAPRPRLSVVGAASPRTEARELRRLWRRYLVRDPWLEGIVVQDLVRS